MQSVSVYHRSDLKPGAMIVGPAIISEDETTSVVLAGYVARINGLGYIGGEDYGFVCLATRGSVNEEQRGQVEAWLKGREELSEFNVSPLMDVWYPENEINAKA